MILGKLGAVPYLIIAAVSFIGGGEIIGGWKANDVRKVCAADHKVIINNAMNQASELAAAWERENAENIDYLNAVEAMEHELRASYGMIDDMTDAHKAELERLHAEADVAACLIDPMRRDILNDWQYLGGPTG